MPSTALPAAARPSARAPALSRPATRASKAMYFAPAAIHARRIAMSSGRRSALGRHLRLRAPLHLPDERTIVGLPRDDRRPVVAATHQVLVGSRAAGRLSAPPCCGSAGSWSPGSASRRARSPVPPRRAPGQELPRRLGARRPRRHREHGEFRRGGAETTENFATEPRRILWLYILRRDTSLSPDLGGPAASIRRHSTLKAPPFSPRLRGEFSCPPRPCQ